MIGRIVYLGCNQPNHDPRKARLGPIALFDKSFIQALNVDEAVLFDYFFYSVVSPLFFVETLADLAKDTGRDRSAEEVVGSIAFKAPEMHGGPCAFHGSMGLSNLMGRELPNNGQIPVQGGRPVRVDGKRGVVFENAPESEAFARWQQGEFWDVERHYAQRWRAIVNGIDLKLLARAAQRFGVDPKSAKNISEVRSLAADVIRRLSAAEQIQLAFQALGVEPHHQNQVLSRWHRAGYPPLVYFAPYAYHVTLVETFFSLALASGKVSSDRPSHRCDISYLHYLPFCLVFVSADKLHRECAPLFLRADQDFVWGPDLKADLASQNRMLHEMYPEEQRERGLISLAPRPCEGLVRQLWAKHVPRALTPSSTKSLSEAGNEMLVEHLERIANSPGEPIPADGMPEDEISSMSIQRMVHKRRGSWFQIPKDLPDVDAGA